MPAVSFRTIQQPCEGTYKEKGSKFLAFAFPVDNEPDIKAHLDAVKKQYFDARHHCYAWMLGPEKKRFRAFDDGEPNHSAGDPILGQMRSKDITNVLIIVVRYFGGVKLGVGGLIAAYKSAAADALAQAQIVEKEITEIFTMLYDYNVTSDVMKLIKEFDLIILQQEFSETCLLRVQISVKRKDSFLQNISLLSALGSTIKLE